MLGTIFNAGTAGDAFCLIDQAAVLNINGADGTTILIDDHGSPVADPVWALYAQTIAQAGPLPTLIEWDNDVPPFAELMSEAQRATAILDATHEARRAHAC